MLLGIDLGTGSAKALLLATDGTTIGEASSSYPVHAPHPGWAESENPIRVSSSHQKRIVLVVHKTVKQNQ
jgi:glycerol kinase